MKDKILGKLNELKNMPQTKEVRKLVSKAKEFIQSIRKPKDDSGLANLTPQ